MDKKPLIIFISIIVFIAFGYFTFISLGIFVSKKVKIALKPVTLNYWRVYDGPDTFSDIIAKYKFLHPNVTINYKKLRYDEYEQELLEGFATDRGPDIFSIHNTWIGKYKSKDLITPLPPSITLAYPSLEGTIQKEVVAKVITKKSHNKRDIENLFVDAVYEDVVYKIVDPETRAVSYEIYGLPLSLDTLAMFYNKDLLNNAGISSPSPYWDRKFQQDVKKLTKQDVKGNIIQSGVALGGSDNVERFSDILTVLMMQNGTEMINEGGGVLFANVPRDFVDQSYNPGLEAVRFYSDFANPGKEVFSWNDSLDNSINMFAEGKLAMLFAYSYHLPTIKAKSEKLNFNISKLPQINGNDRDVNFANYWVEVVSKKASDSNVAWDFVQFATAEEQAKTYVDKTKKPTALRSLVSSQIDDLDIGIFADQVLTAKSWYKGNNAIAAENYFKELIDEVNKGPENLEDLLGFTASRVQQTIKEK